LHSKIILRIACFISCHGFGHATRSFAVIQKLAELKKVSVCIFSSLPDWFLKENLSGIQYTNHSVITDVGLVQKNPFHHDLNLTLKKLNLFLKFEKKTIQSVVKVIRVEPVDFILSDISPLGLYIGEKLKIPTCLLENFTWDWIYQEYISNYVGFKKPIQQLQKIFNTADLHLQTNPICSRARRAKLVNPIYRPHKKSTSEIKQKIGIDLARPIVLVTTGGIPQEYKFIDKIKKDKIHFYILTGAFDKKEISKNFCLLPHKNDFFFPDLVHASSGVVGKIGYGTVSEAWGSVKPLMRIYRDSFRETIPMKKFVDKHLNGFEITHDSFVRGDWLEMVDQLINESPCKKTSSVQLINGRDEVAKIILDWEANHFSSET
jgi:uncharacterized protein (TIGR00661 family)